MCYMNTMMEKQKHRLALPSSVLNGCLQIDTQFNAFLHCNVCNNCHTLSMMD